jgi:long-chain acyl-CoA synthetase
VSLGTVILGDRRLGGEALEQRVAKAAGLFKSYDIAQGDRVALLLRNDLAFFEATFAAQALGAYPVPVNWHFSTEEILYVLADSGAKVLVGHTDLLAQIMPHLPNGLVVLSVAVDPLIAADYSASPPIGELPSGVADWDQAVDTATALDLSQKPVPASMIYTSGTTGKPKGVRRAPPTPEEAAAALVARKYVFGFKPEMISLMTGPLYHSAPNIYANYTIRFGGQMYLMPRFDPHGFLDLVARHRITHAHMVPTMFVRLLRLDESVRRAADLSSLEWIIHGAAPCSPDIKRRMIEWFGPIIHEYYGSTESGVPVHCDSTQWLAHPGSVGRAIPGASVEIHDETGKVLGPRQIGEIYARFWANPDFTYHGRDDDRRSIEREGLITSGDVGYLDEDGFLYLCDRKRDMVISGGVNIYPAEIEHVLIQMPGVKDCAIFGIPHEEFGEALAAAIETDSALTEESVREFLTARVAKYKVPRVVTFHEQLPREDSGKIFKRRLRDPYWAQAGRNI